MRARGLLLVIVATFVSACGLGSGDDDASGATPLPAVTTTTTTLTTTTVPRPRLTYDAELLDGGTMTIEEDVGELSEFTQGKPTAIHDLDMLAALPDCEAARPQRLGLDLEGRIHRRRAEGVRLREARRQPLQVHRMRDRERTAADRRRSGTGSPLRHVRGGEQRGIRRLSQG